MTTYLEQAVAYWRARAEAAEQRLREAAGVHPDIPPEPPIGTDYVLSDGDVVWRRTDLGWFCARACCLNCPAEWAEVWDRDLSGPRSGLAQRLP